MKKFLAIFLTFLISACDWSYEGSTGPKNWGSMKEEYKFCGIGYNQSPIDVKYEFIDNELKFSYALSDVAKERKDYVMNINFDGANILLRGKKRYNLRRLSFHHPSEHLINSKSHSLEMQVMHKSEDEQWLGLAVFLEVGKANPDFEPLVKILSQKKDGKFDLSKIIKENDKVFYYDGSLTTPPCTEGVKWYVMKTPLEISKEQMNVIIKKAIFVKSNARPVQAYHPEKY